MAETSFPIKEQPLSDLQWGQVIEGFGSGILARGSEPYGIPGGGIDNAANTVKLAGRGPVNNEGHAVVSGFLHRYDADMTLPIPAVTKTTTYYIGLTYDPTQHAAAGGPVKVTVTTAAPAGGGKVYLPIYTIQRSPNQLLSDAVITDQRAFIAPQITVQGVAALPPASSVLWYTIATDWLTGDQYQIGKDGKWGQIGVPSIRPTLATSGWSQTTAGIVTTPIAGGKVFCQLEIEMARTANAFTQGTTFTTHGTLIPPDVRSPSRGIIYCPAMIGTSPGVVALNVANGQVMARLYSGTAPMVAGSRISFSAMWVA